LIIFTGFPVVNLRTYCPPRAVCLPREGGDLEYWDNMSSYWVYILCSKRNVGVTKDLSRRVYEHKHKLVAGFTKKYDVNKLVHVESFNDINAAIHREKCIKKWNRTWTLRLIEERNPAWQDLSQELP
jgi:putative endonuclease